MPDHPIVVIGASAGGVSALSTLVQELPADFSAAVYIVLHIPAQTPSRLQEILGRVCKLPVSSARDGEPIRAGRVVVAPADRHLMLDRGHVRVTRGPKECRVRPAIDVLFRSAAAAYGPSVIGVVLTGTLDDGTAGLWAVKDRGGVALVQQPETAEYPSMPESALRHVEVDGAFAIDDIAKELVRRVARGIARHELPAPPPERMRIENLIAREGNGLQAGSLELGEKSKYTCPSCHGALVQIEEGAIVRFRCHTGHAFSIKTLLAEVTDAIDTGLWDTLRAVEERILLLQQIEALATLEGATGAAAAAGAQARDAQARVEALRALVLDDKMFGHLPEE